MALHQITYPVTFGDCDPAGIVFYPNIYKWLDRCFHDWLRGFGGHAALCARFDLLGMGLTEATARFRRPILDGHDVVVTLDALDWSNKGLAATYNGHVGETLCFTGVEHRALFVRTTDGIKAGQTQALKAHLKADPTQADGEGR